MNCEDCGQPRRPGDWPFCEDGTGKHGHDVARGMHTYQPYVDENISPDGKPVLITSLAQRNKYFKPFWEGDHIAHIRERKAPTKGDLSARRDRCEARLAQQRANGGR